MLVKFLFFVFFSSFANDEIQACWQKDRISGKSLLRNCIKYLPGVINHRNLADYSHCNMIFKNSVTFPKKTYFCIPQ